MWRLLLLVALPLSPGSAQQGAKPELDTRPRKLDCDHIEWMREGRPVFVDSSDGVRLGISTKKNVVGPAESVIVDIWVDNRSDKPVLSGGRCPPYLHSGDVFDSSGHRLVSNREHAKIDAEKNGQTTVEVCSMTEVLVDVPAHTCMAPVDAHGGNFTLDYRLRPGVYYVFPTRGTDPKLFNQGLKITVRER